jgi:hypothetical protein
MVSLLYGLGRDTSSRLLGPWAGKRGAGLMIPRGLSSRDMDFWAYRLVLGLRVDHSSSSSRGRISSSSGLNRRVYAGASLMAGWLDWPSIQLFPIGRGLRSLPRLANFCRRAIWDDLSLTGIGLTISLSFLARP